MELDILLGPASLDSMERRTEAYVLLIARHLPALQAARQAGKDVSAWLQEEKGLLD